MRGVILAVCVLSPVESSSLLRGFSNYNSLLRLCRLFGKRAFVTFLVRKFAKTNFRGKTFAPAWHGETPAKDLLNEEAFAELIPPDKHF